jgi:hypothetical protein
MTEREQPKREQQRQSERKPSQDPTQDPAVGHVTEGPRDYYGRPMGEGETDNAITDEYGRPLENGQDAFERPVSSSRTDEYGRPAKSDSGAPTETPPDTRAADDTLGGYGGVAGGKDERPEQQRKTEKR